MESSSKGRYNTLVFVIKSLNISKRYLHKYPGGKLPGRQSEGAASSIWKVEGKTKQKTKRNRCKSKQYFCMNSTISWKN